MKSANEGFYTVPQPEKAAEIMELFNETLPQKSVIDERAGDMGKWLAEYMKDAGYFLKGGPAPTLYKQMFMKALPRLNGRSPEDEAAEVNTENMEDFLLRFVSALNSQLEKEKLASYTQAFRNSVVSI